MEIKLAVFLFAALFLGLGCLPGFAGGFGVAAVETSEAGAAYVERTMFATGMFYQDVRQADRLRRDDVHGKVHR